MSATYISAEMRRFVAERAEFRCEYCLVPAAVAFFSHEVDHIVATKHGGKDELQNLAFACWRCNRHKGTDLGSLDPQTVPFVCCLIHAFTRGRTTFLLKPRTWWAGHPRVA